MRHHLAHVGLSALLALVACSGSSSTPGFANDGGGTLGNGDGGTLGGGDGSSGNPPGKTLLYAHTDTTLYQLDPQNITTPMTLIGDFDCIGSGGATAMTDLGVSKDGALYGVSPVAAYPLTITGSTVHCAATWPLPSGSNFYGLTVAPENTVAAQEVLIAADGAGELYQIDANTGNTTLVGTLGTDPVTGTPWSLSGDIVFLSNGGTPVGFATVRTCSGACSKIDTLIEINVGAIKPGSQSVMKSVRGPVQKGSWCTNAASPATFGSMYGIAAYQDKVYGFSRAGDVVEIHNDDGSGCLVTSDPTMKFAGAGVTTSAPVKPPPVK